MLTKNPFWNSLFQSVPLHQQAEMENSLQDIILQKDELLRIGSGACKGAVLVLSGALRAFTTDEAGNEITLLRLKEGDSCVLTASCALESIRFDVTLQAVYQTHILSLPEIQIKQFSDLYPQFAITLQNELLNRFSDVVFLLSSMLGKKMHARLATELLFWMNEESQVLQTHDQLAKNLNTAREVISRTVRYLEQEKYVKAGRGFIQILNRDALEQLSNTIS